MRHAPLVSDGPGASSNVRKTVSALFTTGNSEGWRQVMHAARHDTYTVTRTCVACGAVALCRHVYARRSGAERSTAKPARSHMHYTTHTHKALSPQNAHPPDIVPPPCRRSPGLLCGAHRRFLCAVLRCPQHLSVRPASAVVAPCATFTCRSARSRRACASSPQMTRSRTRTSGH